MRSLRHDRQVDPSRPEAGRVIARLVTALRREGLRFFTRRLAAAARRGAGYQRLVVFRATPSGGAEPHAAVRELSPAEATQLTTIPWDPATIEARHREGARLFAASDGTAHTSFGWVTDGRSMWVDETSCYLTSREPKIWIWDCVTPAEFRGRGQYPMLLRGILRQLGHSRAVIYCRAENRSSRRGIEKAGFAAGESIIRLRRRVWVRRRGTGDAVAVSDDPNIR